MISRILTLFLFGLSILRGPSQPAAAAGGRIDCHPIEPSVPGDYWTETRMSSARPTPLLGEDSSAAGTRARSGGRPKTFAALADLAVLPYSAGGRLFYTKGSQAFWCSAQFIETDHRLLTAAHCVRDWKTGTWYSNFFFKRAYDGPHTGQSVLLKSVATWHNYRGDWKQNSSLDYAFFHTDTPSTGGWITLGAPAANSLTAIGYPKNFGDGNEMYSVKGAKGKVAGGLVEMLGNPLGSGSSGGAWLGGEPSAVVGLNSTYADSVTKKSPLFDQKTKRLMDDVAARCPKSPE